MTDQELDKLRHLAIRRDVLAIVEHQVEIPLVMLDTAQSVLVVTTMFGGWELVKIRSADRDGKVGLILARFESLLPLLDLRYFDFVVYAGEGSAEATSEALQILGVGCRRDAFMGVHNYEPDSGCQSVVDRWSAKTGRVLQLVDRLAILTDGSGRDRGGCKGA